ncbi:MAG: hypothetical protein J6A01_02830 [Proteobacteria bacterium]|nr:hypothetical protein [Pseudomonadota bacterium]
MKQNRLYLVCLCAVLGLSFTGCGEDSDKTGGCSPTTAPQDCGDPAVFYCDAVSKTCKRFIPEHCLNGSTDTSVETDVDCGGACVSEAYVVPAQNIDYRQTCNIGKTCIVNDDCTSGVCEGNVCIAKSCETKADCNPGETCDHNACVSCTDNKLNQDETDVDCGGVCATYSEPKRCEVGKKCKVPNDCVSGSCVCPKDKCDENDDLVCKEAEYAVADPTKLIINELQDVSKSTPPFALNDNVTACEFIEIANPDKTGYKLDGVKLVVQREDKEGSFEIDLSNNIIQPQSLAVIHNCDNLPLHEKVLSIKSDALSIVGSGTYSFVLVAGDKASAPVRIKFAQYASSYNREIDFDANANMNKTTSIGKNAAAATPGYCLNGGLYHENCVTHCANGEKDEDESGVDCGGSLCEKCKDEAQCKDYKDCAGGYCYKDPEKGSTDDKGVYHEPEYGVCEVCTKNEQCKQTNAVCKMDPILDENGDPTGETNNYCAVPETCSDKQLNQDETDTDCGGICGSTCKVGQVCGSGADCMSTICEDGKCGGTDPAKNDVNVLVINEIYDASGSKNAPTFPLNRNNASCEFVEIANVSDSNVSLEGVKLIIKKTNKVENPKEIKLTGALDAKKILLVHSCKENQLDYPASDVRIQYNSSFLTDKYTYNLYLEDEAGNTTFAVDFDATEKDYSSSMNHKVDFDPESDMVKTISIPGAAAFATPGYCANGGLFSLNCQNYCADTLLNGNESAADCGGNCTPCELGKSCSIYADCLSGVCKGNVCSKCSEDKHCQSGTCNTVTGLCETEPTCNDKLQNQDETDVDCGGSCKACALDQKCKEDTDCETNECTSGKCTGTAVPGASVDDLIINEFMAAEDTTSNSTSFFTINGDNIKECKFIEIVNISDHTVKLDGCKANIYRQDADKKSENSLSGIVTPKGGIVVHNCETLPLPNDFIQSKLANTSNITQGGTYKVQVICNDVEGDSIDVDPAVKGTSMNLPHDLQVGALDMIEHTSVPGSIAVASPGYCVNGGTFSTGCEVDCNNNGESCGGICAPCENGKKCSKPKDCASGQCEGGKCTGEIAENASSDDMLINEVMVYADAGKTFSYNNDAAQCRFIEVVNISGKTLKLDGCSAILERTDGTQAGKKNENKLTGTLQSKGVVIIHNCEASLPLPEGTLTQTLNTTSMSQSGTYESYMSCSGADGSHVTIGKASKGISMTLPTDLDVSAKEMVSHASEDIPALASPGYCANGKLFKDDCK